MEKYLISEAFNKLSNKQLHKGLPRDKRERERLAYSSNTSQSILSELAKDKDESVRMYVANNSNTPLKILKKLSNDEKPAVRAQVALNRSIPLDILDKLGQDEAAFVRYKVLMNDLVTPTPDILKVLAQDENDDIKELAIQRLNELNIVADYNEDDFGYTDDDFDDYR